MHLTLYSHKRQCLIIYTICLIESNLNFSSLKGLNATNQDLPKVAEISGVLDAPDDFLSANLRSLFSAFVPEPEKFQCNEFVQKYLLFKQRNLDSISA